jgi:hypothetical protein
MCHEVVCFRFLTHNKNLLRVFRHFFGDAFDNFRHTADGIFQGLERNLHDLRSHALDVAETPREEGFIRLGFFKRGLDLLQFRFTSSFFRRDDPFSNNLIDDLKKGAS